jgi:predicted enzyme related to lactoylglutathione lyase
MKKPNPVVHFEMPSEDKARTKKFYEEAFGWQMQQMGADFGDYLLATTTPTDPQTTRPTEPGAINGGFFNKGEYGDMPHLVISVDNLEESVELVKNAGGTIDGEPSDIPGIGKFVMIRDTEGNRVGMLQPSPMQ